jgi:hypothetical protein
VPAAELQADPVPTGTLYTVFALSTLSPAETAALLTTGRVLADRQTDTRARVAFVRGT